MKQAQLGETVVPVVLGGALIAGIAIISSDQGQIAKPTSTSTSTSP